ncbi:MAG TPA: CheR family methyltransferase, partial [Burkholderiaceae bacterium]|nr:CheR family methyltransferase [Burkholderiaceae bacterium]
MSAVPARVLPQPVAPAAEFSFGSADFDRVCALIHKRAGISLHAGKQAMVYSRLSRRLRELGHGSFGSYLQWLEGAQGEPAEQEWQEFVNCLTTNLTSFFREAHHFVLLAQELQRTRSTPPRLWCAAASTGEEPYSMAMTALEAPRASVKTIETRSWSTSFRGPLAIHAGKAQPGSFERVGDWVTSMWGDGSWSMVERPSGSLDPVRCVELPLGAVVAVADLVDVVPIHEWMCSCDLADGPYALVSGTSMGPESIVGLFYAPSGAGFKPPMWGPSSLDCLDPRHPRQQA